MDLQRSHNSKNLFNMKKTLLTAAIAAILGIGGYHGVANDPNEGLTPAQMENLEALTSGENGECKSCHWYVTYLGLDGSYRCYEGGSHVCVAVWPL